MANEGSVSEEVHANQQCPLCGNDQFSDLKGRGKIICTACGSNPRTRLAWLLLSDYAKLAPGSKVAHFAPEAPLARKLHSLCGTGYQAFDFQPARYQSRVPFTPIIPFNLCTDITTLEMGSFDAVVHNHVMEHVPCNYVVVLQRLQKLLREGGVQVFSVPISKGHTRSDLAPNLSGSLRTKYFGQHDHLVKFGSEDHDMNLGMVFDQTNETYHLENLLDEQKLIAANVPRSMWRPSGSTVFAVVQRQQVRL